MPLVLHPSSECDVCLDPWVPKNPPYAINCGHIFCRTCLTNITPRNCPLDRRHFSIDQIRKLYVDFPGASDPRPNPAVELLQRLVLASRETASDEFVKQVIGEAEAFLAEHANDTVSCEPLAAAIEALSRMDAMREAFENQARDYAQQALEHARQSAEASTRFDTMKEGLENQVREHARRVDEAIARFDAMKEAHANQARKRAQQTTEALIRFDATKEALEELAREHAQEARSWEDKVQTAQGDHETSKADQAPYAARPGTSPPTPTHSRPLRCLPAKYSMSPRASVHLHTPGLESATRSAAPSARRPRWR